MDITTATAQDARAIAEVQVSSWQRAYAGLLPEPYLASLDVDRREANWRAALAAGRPQVLVVRAEGAVQGFVAFGASRDADAPPACAEIWAFYLAPSAWSRGWGRALWIEAAAQMRAQAFARVSLWVLARNARAIRFYAAAGFVADAQSARPITVGGVQLQELRCSCSPMTASAPGSA